MASYSTVLNTYSYDPNGVTWYVPSAHFASQPYLVQQRREPDSSRKLVLEDRLVIIRGVTTEGGEPLVARSTLGAVVRVAKNTAPDQLDDLIVTFRDLVNSDQFVNLVKQRALIKG